jgi:hypothetical protein
MARRDGGRTQSHNHFWLLGLLALAAGLLMMIYVPSLPAVSGTILLFAGFHIIGGLIVLATLYLAAGAPWMRRRAAAKAGFDFGWAPAWLYGPWVAANIAAPAGVAIEVAAPSWWPLANAAILLSACCFASGLVARMAARYDHAVLPMVDLLRSGEEMVLDAGCGAGRTSIALGRASRRSGSWRWIVSIPIISRMVGGLCSSKISSWAG